MAAGKLAAAAKPCNSRSRFYVVALGDGLASGRAVSPFLRTAAGARREPPPDLEGGEQTRARPPRLTTRPATRLTTRPATRLTMRPATRPTSRPVTHPATRATPRLATRPTAPPTLPATAPARARAMRGATAAAAAVQAAGSGSWPG